jgi:S-DNA-T family DNA segregation ATPase FtsK/SpoIIIE
MPRKKPSPSRKPTRAKGSSRSTTRRQESSKPTLDEWLIDFASPRRLELLGILLVIFGAFTLVALAGFSLGNAPAWWGRMANRVFGWGSWLVALSIIFAGLHLALHSVGRPWQITARQVIGFEIALVTALALSHLTGADEAQSSLARAIEGKGGGYIGWALAVPLVEGVGRLMAWLLLTVAWLYGIGLVLRVTWGDVQRRITDLSAGMQEWAASIAGSQVESDDDLVAESHLAVSSAPRRSKPKKKKPARPAQPKPTVPPHELVIARPASRGGQAPSRPDHLPPLDLLESGTLVEQNEDEIRRRAALIETTLLDFGLPVQVVEVRRGPAVTQFGIAPQFIEKPGTKGETREQKVRVSQITALTSDLALALAASSIRMEAPVPGRPIVGVEVPNEATSLVHLRPVLESPQFYKLKTPLAIGLGLDVSGAAVAADLGKMPHLLIAGTTGSGKSVCINALTTCLVCNNRPDELRLVMVDPKMVELVRFNGLPHLLGQVEVELDRIIGVFRWVTREMDERYKLLAEQGVRNLDDYNVLAKRRKKLDKLPYIILLVDELSDLMMMAPEEVEGTLVRLAQMARAVGIHLVVATQRPSTDVVTGLIKANFPARIAFAVASGIDSRVILDHVGAETLLGKGDMLFQAPDAAKPVRLQGCFVSDMEAERVVSYWREEAGTSGTSPETSAPWDDLLSRQSVIQETDSLLEEAITLAQDNETISTSLIQRRLRIGYPRAARLMDALEKIGVVGAETYGGRTRDVLVDKDDDPLGDFVQEDTES